MITLIAIVIFLLLLTAGTVWIFINPGYVLNNGIVRVNLQGKIQLQILRSLAPMITGVSKSIGFVKYPMEKLVRIQVPTNYGKAELTVYRPLGFADARLPLYINHHGGGFVIGYAKQDDMICRYLARHAGCMVVNVEYVLAPEHPYPAQVIQCYQVAEWLKENSEELNIDPLRIAVGGQSAGATISAALCLMAKELGHSQFCLQILNYGYFDIEQEPTDKFIEKGRRQALGPKMLGLFQNLYLPFVADRKEPLASPLLAPDLKGLPDALVMTAGHDLIKVDGNEYAEKLRLVGVNVVHQEFKDADHGFIHNGPKEAAHTALDLMADILKKAYDPG